MSPGVVTALGEIGSWNIHKNTPELRLKARLGGDDAAFPSLSEELDVARVRLWVGENVPEILGELSSLNPKSTWNFPAQAPVLPFHIFLLICAPGPKG